MTGEDRASMSVHFCVVVRGLAQEGYVKVCDLLCSASKCGLWENSKSYENMIFRHFSTARRIAQQYLVIAEDVAEKHILERRLDVRPAHLNAIEAQVAAGRCIMGGAMLNDGKLIGSALILEAENATEVRKMIKDDPYVTEGVWDVNKIQIIPFKLAIKA